MWLAIFFFDEWDINVHIYSTQKFIECRFPIKKLFAVVFVAEPNLSLLSLFRPRQPS